MEKLFDNSPNKIISISKMIVFTSIPIIFLISICQTGYIFYNLFTEGQNIIIFLKELLMLSHLYMLSIILFSAYRIDYLSKRNPFNPLISKYVNLIGTSILFKAIVEIIIENTNNIDSGLVMLVELNYSIIFTMSISIVFFIFSNIYKKACLIKEENDFTI